LDVVRIKKRLVSLGYKYEDAEDAVQREEGYSTKAPLTESSAFKHTRLHENPKADLRVLS